MARTEMTDEKIKDLCAGARGECVDAGMTAEQVEAVSKLAILMASLVLKNSVQIVSRKVEEMTNG